MKTLQQIERKAKKLKSKLDGKRVYENFGQTEDNELRDFVGCVHDYQPQLLKDKVIDILSDFFNWCVNYMGK